ncbi:hypothetical protein LTR64_007068 [Lithohypha guttulata]|uniref:uncharacterized protein n=1 Tax=Lithohypha guttulata TaxID=1690604 RepID=UPI002DE09614|nr:hypothetical protein LTR51_004376 [Lithohypha guttulata]
MAPPLPPNKRYIATHDANGKSVYASSPDQVYIAPAGSAINVARSYSVPNVPVNFADDEDLKGYLAGPESVSSFQRTEIVVPSEGGNNNGANCLVVDLQPGAFSVMHQTVSNDFSICVIGTIVHELDSGERVTLKAGDHIVQRGTNHRWINASKTEPARFVAVTIPSVPLEIGGEVLEEVHIPDQSSYQPKL